MRIRFSVEVHFSYFSTMFSKFGLVYRGRLVPFSTVLFMVLLFKRERYSERVFSITQSL
jgi:hypothetical protein